MKAWTLNSPTQSPGDLQHSWEQTKDVGVADALTDNVQRKDKDEEDKEDVDTEEVRVAIFNALGIIEGSCLEVHAA